MWKNVVQKAAVILLVFSLSLGSLMAVSPTVGPQWYVGSRNGMRHMWYIDFGEHIPEKCHSMTITDLPEGMSKIRSKILCKTFYVSKQRNRDRSIYFDYAYMQQGSAWTVTDGAENIAVTVNGLEGEMF